MLLKKNIKNKFKKSYRLRVRVRGYSDSKKIIKKEEKSYQPRVRVRGKSENKNSKKSFKLIKNYNKRKIKVNKKLNKL